MTKEAEWFGEWFDSPYYHILYKNRDFSEAERFINNLNEYLQPKEKASAIDLACGKGRHAIQLNNLGLSVLGLDLSPQSISAASEFSNDNLAFQVHDMREEIASGPVDFVFNLFTSFGYFETDAEDVNVLEAVRKVLKKDGIAVLDYMNAEKVAKGLVTQESKEVEGVTFNISRNFTGTHIEKSIDFADGGNQYSFQEKVKYINLEKFETLTQKAGLKIEKTFGDYDLNPFHPETSDRLILVLTKN